MSIIPSDKKKLRACMLCSLVKKETQFKEDGCDNCEQVLHLQDDPEKIQECTSAQFDGVIGLVNQRGWVAKWQRIDKFKRGLYAIRVTGRLPIEVEESLMDRGIKYRPRDGSVRD
ncbi:Spt4/RpoE2 zinc finger-domain-containing protein [Gorgonomyces haynaldii]|nr:Spt4/RpoE2 zinc finger-domain-containing protein [Gorgonomyces haynaldii]